MFNKVFAVIIVIVFSGCAHILGEPYKLMKLDCPNGSRVEIKVPVDDKALSKDEMRKRVMKACNIVDKK